MDPFSGSSKAFQYFEAGLDSERRFKKSNSVSTNASSSFPLAPFDYPSPSVSASSSSSPASSPPTSPPLSLEPPIQLGAPLFPASVPPRPVKQRKDTYDLENLPLPISRTTSSSHALSQRKKPDPRKVEEQLWNEAMAKGFGQAPTGKVKIDLSDKGLTFIPVNVTDMGNYTAVPSPFKEYKGLSSGKNYHSPYASPATSPGRTATTGRTFSRVSSAPASTTAAQANLAALQERRLDQQGGSPRAVGGPLSPSVSFALSSGGERVSADTPPSSPMSSTASTTPRAPPPPAAQRLLPGRPPLGSSSRTGLQARAVSFAPTSAYLSPASSPKGPSPSLVPIDLILSNNQISKLPSQLFELKNLRFLTLRQNNLTTLPAAISALTNLEELNIGANKITYLPSTILDMTHLTHIILHPNPFMQRPKPSSSTSLARPTLPRRSSSSTTTIDEPPSVIPTLYELCLRVLLSQAADPLDPTALQSPPFFTAYPDLATLGAFGSAAQLRAYALFDDEEAERRSLALLEPRGAGGQRLDRGIDCEAIHQEDAERVIACLRSSAPGKLRPSLTNDEETDEDASFNPFYEPCPDPRLGERGVRRVFLTPVEERFEWLRIPGMVGGERFPVRFRGATVGSLNFLDELVREDSERAAAGGRTASGTQRTELAEAEEEEGDGFDLDELDETPAF